MKCIEADSLEDALRKIQPVVAGLVGAEILVPGVDLKRVNGRLFDFDTAVLTGIMQTED